jgi:cell filamentation protein
MNAMIKSPSNSKEIKKLIENALTDEIHSREMFMKGIDYSYYYEE